ncbi:hypothetical protein STAFG_8274 [Streptomyces afghaniensis 772]|uniref:Uncharacterized protein n=1 Tax=Streptomyces afghaniensis 772 TaxID=1283301 RepID=S4M617_9ACTN|nr:hypothetical protein STAFG_8274 [Streptomyces afghaniensis 772]
MTSTYVDNPLSSTSIDKPNGRPEPGPAVNAYNSAGTTDW